MSRPIFLHEFIDIVGQGAWPYMEHTKRCSGDEANGLELLGTWYTMGLTGRWPQCVNIWELPGGWNGWAHTIDRLGLKRERNTALSSWWEEAYKHRSGGFDRQMAGIPGCPTMASLAADGVKGDLFVHELSEVRPGAALDYLGAMQDEWMPVAREYGLEPVGLYEVLMSDTEVVTVWAGSVAAVVKLGRIYDACRGLDEGVEADDRVARWRERARLYTTRWREELMTPCPGTICCPADMAAE
ncbi:MAG: hypothetical protein JRG86_14200 [Deltaproteobacteria bacterium]|jgi:hypothetical protein|nr:hypothetical protein [Deltaproteobacteria bacterium]MBW2498832.1 hypothetical protein [Deltaproteobacteria bacterium]